MREASLTGASFFAAFSLFWTILVLLLTAPPFYLGSQEAGLFAIVGMAGVLAAPWAGKLTDRRGPRIVIWLVIALMAFSFLILRCNSDNIIGLLAGVIMLDVGLQIMQTSNQSRACALRPEARSRLNTVYMVCYFAGGFWLRYWVLGMAVFSVA